MKKAALITLAAAAAILAGCASAPKDDSNSTSGAAPYGSDSAILLLESKPEIGKSRDQLLTAVTDAARAQLADITATRSAPSYPLPPGKPAFTMKDLSEGTYSGALASTFRRPIKVPTCENPVLTIRGSNSDAKETGEAASLFVCVMQYAGGYRTAIYVSHEKSSTLFSKISKKQPSVNGQLFIPQSISAVRAAVEKNTANTKVIDPAITAK